MKDLPNKKPTRGAAISRIVREGAAIVLLGSLSGLVANLLHERERLPLIATKPYDITVPCPEPVGTVTATPPNSPWLKERTTYVIDARLASEFAAWHFPQAVNAPFDWLGPPVQEEVGQLAKRIAASGFQRILVYGDGDNPDSGREWARLLAGGGIRNVGYVEGGAAALRAAQEPIPTASTEPSP